MFYSQYRRIWKFEKHFVLTLMYFLINLLNSFSFSPSLSRHICVGNHLDFPYKKLQGAAFVSLKLSDNSAVSWNPVTKHAAHASEILSSELQMFVFGAGPVRIEMKGETMARSRKMLYFARERKLIVDWKELFCFDCGNRKIVYKDEYEVHILILFSEDDFILSCK